jgi:hypothetical protein
MCTQFALESLTEETTWKTEAYMGGLKLILRKWGFVVWTGFI